MSERIPAIGTLRDRVQLLRKDTTVEAEGGHATSFVAVATVWARVRALSGSQSLRNDGQSVGLSHTVVLRFRSDISPGDRIIYRGQNLDVVTTKDLNGRRAYLSCSCTHNQQVG